MLTEQLYFTDLQQKSATVCGQKDVATKDRQV